MNTDMTKQTSIMLGAIIIVLIGAVTLLLALGREVDSLISFLSATIVPAVVALWAGNKADKANKNAEKAVQNTNGRMSELIATVQALGGTVDESKYADVIGAPSVHHDPVD